jgi:hypothetical protein
MTIKRPAKKGDYAFGCNECGIMAWWRPCFRPGEDKGSYRVGRGYLTYRKNPPKICLTRITQGCPYINININIHVLNPPDIEKFIEYLKEDGIHGKEKQKRYNEAIEFLHCLKTEYLDRFFEEEKNKEKMVIEDEY